MSAEALLDIQKILCQHKISAKVTTWYQEGKAKTKIILKDLAGSQPKNLPVIFSEKKRKTPSRVRRDAKRRTEHVAKLAGSCDAGPAAATPVLLSTAQRTGTTSSPRRTATLHRRLGEGRAGTAKRGVTWGPGMGVEESSIPQLDGGGGGEGGSGGKEEDEQVDEPPWPFQPPQEEKEDFEDEEEEEEDDEEWEKDDEEEIDSEGKD